MNVLVGIGKKYRLPIVQLLVRIDSYVIISQALGPQLVQVTYYVEMLTVSSISDAVNIYDTERVFFFNFTKQMSIVGIAFSNTKKNTIVLFSSSQIEFAILGCVSIKKMQSTIFHFIRQFICFTQEVEIKDGIDKTIRLYFVTNCA